MPGRGSYGASGKWIHDRAHHIMGKNPDMPKGMAYAVATQQAHKVGKSPKGFRTEEGVRTARAKHAFPKSFYKKTASANKNIALNRLRRLRKEARAKKFVQTRTTGYVGPRVQYAVEKALGAHRPIPVAPPPIPEQYLKTVEPSKLSKLMKNPKLRKALKFGGLGALGLGAGAVGHGLAHAVGATETGPADTLADIIVPEAKYSFDYSTQRRKMYIPRFYLEKAAASMAGALDTNHDTIFEGESERHGPEASVVPQQTLDTVTPIMQYVDASDEEADDILSRMFERYKETEEESVGRYTKGETEIPLSKQAGCLMIR